MQFQPQEQLSERIYQTPIEGLFFIKHNVHSDDRGFYSELGIIPELENVIKQKFEIKQLNLSNSKTNVIRGFHAENWNKLATVVSGKAFCVFADIRKDSPTFKQTVSIMLGDDKDCQQGSIFISSGIGNSFLSLKGPVNYLYAVDQVYDERDKTHDQAISLFDPELAVIWPIEEEEMIISDRDRQAINLSQLG